MNIDKKTAVYIYFLAFLLTLFFLPCSLSYTDVQQVFPEDNHVYTTPAATLQCNATGNESVTSLSINIYTSTATITNTTHYKQLQQDTNTLLLCHFNGNYECGNENATPSGTSFNYSTIGLGILINDSDTLTFPCSGNIDIDEGTIEFWIKTPEDIQSQSWIFIAGDDPTFNKNEIRLWIENSMLYFRIYNDFEEASTVTRSISSWENGSWHYIEAVWDTSVGGPNDWDWMDLSVDGSNQSNSYTVGDYLMYKNTITGNMHIGSYKDGTMQINTTIDELRISDRKRNFTEINDTYHSFFSVANITSSWTFQNLTDGTYTWNCRASAINLYQTFSQNRTFFVDNSTPPSINKITLTPNSSDDVDPDITITVTANITDPSNVSSAVLYYKRSTVSTWTAEAMNYTGNNEWTASFSVPSPPGTWDYMVWSNDTHGNSGYSPQYNITAEFDYSWSASPSHLGEKYIYLNTEDTIGVLSIVNTGDYPLNFRITSDFPSTHFNISNPESFDIDANSTLYINITATAPAEPGEYPIHITINETSDTTSPSVVMINATLISYWGGPYLISDIVQYEAIVYQSTSNITYAFKTRNIGNETAQNIWINWSLPEGWSVVSGNLTLFIGNLTNSSVAWNNITVSITSSARAGVISIYANASSSGNVTTSSHVTVSVICNSSDGVCGSGCSYVSDSDCSPPPSTVSSGGSSAIAGGGTTILSYRILFSVPQRVDAEQNTTQTFRITIANPTENTVLRHTCLTFSGYPQTLIKTTPSSADIPANRTQIFFVTIKIPSYMEYGKRNIIVYATANATSSFETKTQSLTNSTQIPLYIHTSSISSSQNILSEALSAITQIRSLGADTEKAEKLVLQIRRYLNESRKDEAMDTLRSILDELERASRTKSLIDRVKNNIEDASRYGIDAAKTRVLYSLALSAFSRGDFRRSEDRAKNALIVYEAETSATLSLIKFVYSYWWMFLLFIVVAFASFILMKRKIRITLAKRKLRSLRDEEKGIDIAMKSLQKSYFTEKSISKKDYDSALSHYTGRLARIKSEKIRQKIILDSLSGKPTRKTLSEKKEKLESMIKDIQKQYFEAGNISKQIYEKTLSALMKELAETEKQMAPQNKKRNTAKILLMLIISCLFVAFLSFPIRSQLHDCISNATLIIGEMKDAGFGIERVSDMLNEAKFLLSQGHETAACALADKIRETRNTAFRISRLIDDIESEIYETRVAGYNITEPESIFSLAIDAFEREDYAEAEALLSRASDSIDSIHSGASVQTEPARITDLLVSSFYAHYSELIMLSFLACLSLYFFNKTRSSRARKALLAKLLDEERKITSSIKTIQIQYFHAGKKSKREYDEAMKHYRQKLAEIRKQIILITTKPEIMRNNKSKG